MRKLTCSLLCCLGLATFGITGCQSTDAMAKTDASCCAEGACDGSCGGDAQATITSASNDACPFSGNAVNASVSTVSYQGKEIGFCCGGCAEKFAAMSDAEKAAALGG